MEYIKPSTSIGKILCCECGVSIEPNPSNQCIGCIRAKNDISEDIPKTTSICFCKGCERYLDPPSSWVKASLESKPLLKLCLKRIRGLSHVRLVDAGFVWTEPHSKRIKVKLTIQKEIQTGAVLQQEFIVEVSVQGQLCEDCHRVEAKDFWNVIVQVRQKADHKRTFYYVEQLILKHRIHEQTLDIKPVPGGIDFFFATEQTSNKMLDFLSSVVPCRWVKSKKLKSHDIHSNIFNYKHSVSVEIVPICKDSVVCIPPKVAHQHGGINQICIVHRVTNNIFLIDPSSAQMAELNAATYWRSPFNAIETSRKMIQFTVIDISEADIGHMKGKGHISNKHVVNEVWVQRSNELGTGETIFCRSHLGKILVHGDEVLGYDLKNSNVNDTYLEAIPPSDVPDVILVKKVFASKAQRNRRRKWKLRHLGLDDDINSQNRDYTDFLEDLEEDDQIRSNVNIYQNRDKLELPSATPSEIEVEMPRIGVEEMLEDLVVESSSDSEDEYEDAKSDL